MCNRQTVSPTFSRFSSGCLHRYNDSMHEGKLPALLIIQEYSIRRMRRDMIG